MDIDAIKKKYGITHYTPKAELKLTDSTMKPPPPLVPKRTWGEAGTDTLKQLASGVGGLVQIGGDLQMLIDANIPNLTLAPKTQNPTGQNALQTLGGEAQKYWTDQYSPAYKAQEQQMQAASDAKAKSEGEVAGFVETLNQLKSNPSHIAGKIIESAPQFLPGVGIGKAVTALGTALKYAPEVVAKMAGSAAVGTGVIQQASSVGGDTMRDLNKDTFLSQDEKENRASMAALESGLISAATTLIPGANILEKSLVGGGSGVRSRLAGAGLGMVGQGVQEVVEEGSGKALNNVYTGKDDTQGVGAVMANALLTGAPMGLAAGAIASPKRFAADKVAPKVADHIAGHEANDAMAKNELMQAPNGEVFDPAVDVGIVREAPSVTDHPADTIEPMDHQAVFGSVMGEHLDSARTEGETVYPKALELAQSGAKPEQIKSFIDNAITPTLDELSISEMVNGGDPLPSRFTGMRIVDVLERNIKIAEADPTIAKTNIDLSNALKKEGFTKELNNVFTKAYAAKDPTILTDYIMAKSQPLSEDIRTQLDEHFAEYKAQSEGQKAARWEASVPPEAVDLVTHPKFLEHLDERKDVSAQDTRYAQTRVADMTLSHENNGQGYETVVQQPAMFERNYNADFEMTKKDVADIKAGRWNETLVQKLRNDLERRDNDPLYNPQKDSETINNDSTTLSNTIETPSQTLHREMSDTMGQEHADMSMGLIEGRARAMDITPDELIQKHPLIVKDMTDTHGLDYVGGNSNYLYQKEAKDLRDQLRDLVKASHTKLSDIPWDDITSIQAQKIHQFLFSDEPVGVFEIGNRKIQIDRNVADKVTIGKHEVATGKTGGVHPDEVASFPKIVKHIKPVEKNIGGRKTHEWTVLTDDGHELRFAVKEVKNGTDALVTVHTKTNAGERVNSQVFKDPMASGSDTESLLQKIQDVKLTEKQINGMIEMGITDEGQMKAIITLFKTADASTLPHELMHWMEKTLSDVERAAVDDILKNHEAGTPRSEALAKMFEKYLAEGVAPTPELKGVFDKFRDWLTKLWENIAHDKNRDFELTDAHRELYRALLGDKDVAARLAQQYEGIVNEKIRAEAEVLFQRSSEDSRNAFQKMNDSYDNVIENIFDSAGKFLRGVDKDGEVIIREPSEYLMVDKAQSVLDWVRKSFATNGRKSDAFIEMAHDFDSMRGFLSDEAKALRDMLKGYDKEQIIDPTPNGNLLTQDEAPKMTTKGALLVRALGGDLDLSLLPPEMHAMYAQMRSVIDANTKALIDAGELSPEHAKENYLKRYYMEHITNKNLSSGKITQSGKHARSELDLDTRLDMGQIEDAAFVITRTMLDQRLQLEKALYFKKMADKFGSDVAKDGYIQMSKKTADDGHTPLYGMLAGKYVPKFVVDALNGAYEIGGFLDSIVKGLAVPVDFIKVTQTVKNPGTHVYNVGSNVYLAYMDGHLTELAEIAMMIKRNPQKFRELTRLASKQGLNGMGVDLEKSILKANTDGKAMTIVKNLLLTQDSKGGDYVRSAYDWEDKIFKLAKFYQEMKKNNGKLNDDMAKKAMSEVNKIYVDHSKPVPKFIRNMDKSGVSPFLSYMWRSAPQVALTTLKHPLRFAAMHSVLAPFGASAIWNAISGNDDDEDKSGMPSWMSMGGFNMMGIENFYKTGTDENGFDSYANLGRMAPGMRFMPDKGELLLLYSDGGFLASFVNIIFTGKTNKGTIYNEYDSSTDKMIKRVAAISEYVLPPVMPLAVPVIQQDKMSDSGSRQFEKDGTVKQETVSIGGRYAQKLVQALNGKRDTYDQPVTVNDVLSQAVGMKSYHVDPNVEKEKRYKEYLPEIKRAINDDDMEKAKEIADKIKALDLPDKKEDDEKGKKEAIKNQKKDMDRELERLGVKKAKSSSSFKMPSFDSVMPKLDLPGN